MNSKQFFCAIGLRESRLELVEDRFVSLRFVTYRCIFLQNSWLELNILTAVMDNAGNLVVAAVVECSDGCALFICGAFVEVWSHVFRITFDA